MHLQKIIKRMTALAVSAVLAMTLVACGGESEPAATDAPTEEKVEDVEEAQEETDPVEEAEDTGADETADATSRAAGGLGDDAGYPAVYSDIVFEMWDDDTADQFALADIDGDGIYELLACDSEGNLNQENTFIYTVYDGEAVLLASVIAGSDGASLSYSENNLIHVTGSMSGMSDVFYGLYDGELLEEFRAEVIYSYDDDGEEIETFEINGEEVTEAEYNDTLEAYIVDSAPYVYIDADGLNVMEYKNGEFVMDTQLAYWDAEGILDELDSITAE